MFAGVGETRAPREKPTNQPFFQSSLAVTDKLEHLINLIQGETWQSLYVISDLKEITQEWGPPGFFLWNWEILQNFLHNVLLGRKLHFTLLGNLLQGSSKHSSLILLTHSDTCLVILHYKQIFINHQDPNCWSALATAPAETSAEAKVASIINNWSERSACASATKWPLNQALFFSPLSLSLSLSRHLLNPLERVVVGF